MAALKCVPENSSWEERAGRSDQGLSSGGAEYFSAGRESGGKVELRSRARGRNGGSPHDYVYASAFIIYDPTCPQTPRR
jgi:hypothetical protein